ncbi:hypothetical protein SAMN04489712_10772 [Thermomonospora echinospora]|uniref:Glyoxalase-like domain-containing protein n=1 Tax=Thermomonospora echinospora TaxID=1992 RepID=A0A1H6BFF8_9ACTN|nr:VOC family protein [Thermomonospora echinospora]SEG59491.1 hypothetical protein SAMN04489712_10772 [Thermomonospora echinospora]
MFRWVWAFVDRPLARLEESADFWTTVTGSSLSPRRGNAMEFATLLPVAGDAHLKLQGVHDGGGAHLDFEVEDIPEAEKTACGLGAEVVRREPGLSVLRSPAGQLFCLVPWEGADSRSPAVTGPDGASSLLDQVCVDIGPADYENEVAFWADLTGWELRSTGSSEFRRLVPDASLPVRILLQRLGEDRPASSHLDFACSDVAAVRTWHEKHGAQVIDVRTAWTVMRDPVGGIYCLTARDPRTGRRPE